MKKYKDVVITIGDPAGCGPEIAVKAINSLLHLRVKFWLIGDAAAIKDFYLYRKIRDKINFIDANTRGIKKLRKGEVSRLAATASLNYLQLGLEIIKKNKFKRLVTAPVSKEAIGLVCPGFSGHTELLAAHFKVSNFAMMMNSPKLKVVLLTRHVPLSRLPVLLKKEKIIKTLSLALCFMKKNMRVKKPRLAMASFNPHAGIETYLGKEDRVLAAAANCFAGKVWGPFPSDSLFLPQNSKKYHCLAACYHDQAMIPFKLTSFECGVNTTLGLPIVRTSPDHGVAFGLVKNKLPLAYTSMKAAVLEAINLIP